MPSIRSQLITDVVETRLNTLSNTAVYRSEVVDQPPVLAGSDRVGRYVVLYPFPGKPGPGGDLAETAVDEEYNFQVTCAAGFSRDCEHLVDDVVALFFGWQPSVAGVVVGTFKPPPGYDPGPVRVDRSISPPRCSVPLQYRSIATAN